MGIFGGQRLQQPVDEDTNPYTAHSDPVWGEIDPRLTAPMPQKRGLFGNVGKVLRTVGDVAMFGPFAGMAREGIERGREMHQQRLLDAESDRAYKDAIAAKALQPDAQWEPFDANGARYQRNTVTGEVKAFPGQNDSVPAFIQEARALGIPDAEAIEIWKQRYSRPEPVVQVAGPNGPVFVPRSDAIGKPAYVRPPAPRSSSAGAAKPPAGFILD